MPKHSVLIKAVFNVRLPLEDESSGPKEAIEKALAELDLHQATAQMEGAEYIEFADEYAGFLVDEYPSCITLQLWRKEFMLPEEPTEHWFDGNKDTLPLLDHSN
jgi:hypothetical protein